MNASKSRHARAATGIWRLRPICMAIGLACAGGLLGASGTVQALPQGGDVVRGQVGIVSPAAGQMDLHQTSDKAVINWQSFSIGRNEAVRIDQPNAHSVLLNRVIGNDPSFIFGKLQANGQVFLLNQRGIVFGQGSQVDAGGFLASTLNMADVDFMAGHVWLTSGATAPGSLRADGHISAPGGSVVLVAPDLSMGGSIAAQRVGLAAASETKVDVEGDGLIFFNLRNDQSSARLAMTGRVQADGGTAEFRAQARGGVADAVLNMDGIVQARSIGQRNGRIVIDSGAGGTTLVSGTVDASGRGAGERGGEVQLLGDRVGLVGAARIDASGDQGGGHVEIGGDFHGQGGLHNAQRTLIASGVEVHADALTRGDGGQIAVWSDDRTDVFGSISARGGALGGNGGAVETSGKQVLNMPQGSVDVSAPSGKAGNWLLDPNNLTIGGTDTNVTSSSAGNTQTFDTTDDSAFLSTATLNAALTNGTTVSVVTGSANTNAQAGNITVNGTVQAPLTSGQSASLQLTAQGNIVFNAGSSVSSGTGRLNLQLNAGTDVNGAGVAGTNVSTITMDPASSINLGGGQLSATALGNVTLGAVNAGSLSVASGGGQVSQAGSGLIIHGTTNIDAGTGAIALGGAGNDFQGAVTVNGAGIALRSLHDLTMSGLTQQGSNQSVSLIAGGTLALSASAIDTGTADLTLASQGGSFATAANLAGQNVSITGSNGVALGHNVTAGGNLQLSSTGQAITQTGGAVVVTGTSTINAGVGNVALTGSGNDFQGAVGVTGGSVALRTLHNLNMASLVKGSNQALSLTAGGTLSIPLGDIDTGSADLTLASLGGVLAMPGNLAGQNVSLTGASGITIDRNVTAHGNLLLTSSGQAITQTTGLIAATGTTGINAGAGNILLGAAGNDFHGAVTANGGAIALRSLNDLTIAGLTQSLTNQGVSLISGGALTLSASAIDTGTADLTLGSAGALVTSGNLAGQNVTIAGGNGIALGGGVTAHGSLQLSTTGHDISQTGGGVVVTGTSTINAGVGNVALTRSGNDFQGSVSVTGGSIALRTLHDLNLAGLTKGANQALSLTAGGTLNVPLGDIDTGTADLTLASLGGSLVLPGNLAGQNVALTGANGITIDRNVTAHGNLQLASNGQPNSQTITETTGLLTVTGSTNIDAGTGAISLVSSGNDFQGVVTVNGGDIALRSLHDLTVAGLTQQGSNHSLSLAAGGTLALSASSIDTGTADLSLVSAGSMVTSGNLAGQNVAIAGGNGITLGGGVTAHGNLQLSSTGQDIAQTGGAVVVTGTSTINAGTGNVALVRSGNDFQGAVSVTGGSVALRTLHDLNIAGLTKGANQALSLTAGGTLNLPVGDIDTGTADLTLASLGGVLAMPGNLAGQNVSLTGANGITMDHNVTAHANLQLSSSGQAILQNAGVLAVAGTTSVDAGTGNILLAQAGNNFGSTVSLSGGSATLQAGGALSLGQLNVSALNVSSHGALDLGQGSVGGVLIAGSNGSTITQAGALTVQGAATLNAGAGDMILGNAGNDFQGPVNVTGNAVQVADRNALQFGQWSANGLNASAAGNIDLGTGTSAGALLVSSQGGTVAQSGAITVAGPTNLVADGGNVAVNLSLAGNHLGGAVTLASANGGQMGAVNLANTDALTVGGNAQGLTARSGGALVFAGGNYGSLDAGAAGSISQTAGLNVSGVTTLTAMGGVPVSIDLATHGDTNELHAVVLAAQQGSALGTVRISDADVVGQNGLQIGGNAADLGIVSGGTLTFTGGNYATLTADTHASNASMAQTGALNVSGLTQLQAGTGDITLSHPANDFSKLVVTAARNVNVHDANDVELGASRVDGQLAFVTPGTATISGALDGNGVLVVGGPGQVVLTAANGYTGGTQVAGGVLVLDGAAARAGSAGTVVLGAGGRIDVRHGAVLDRAVLAQGGTLADSDGTGTVSGNVTLASNTTLDVSPTGQLTISGSVTDGGAGYGVRLQGGGTTNFAGSNDYRGATQVTAGTLLATSVGALPTQSAVVVGAGAALQLGQAQSIGSLTGSGDVRLGGFDLALGNDGTQAQFDGVITGVGRLIKQGNASFTLTGANTYQGDTVVNAGTLVTSTAERLPDASAVQVGANGSLVLGGSETVGSINATGNVTAHGDISTAGDQVYLGALTLANAQATTLSGHLIDARNAANQFGAGVLSLHADSVQLNAAQDLTLGGVTLAQGGQISADRIILGGALQLNGGKLDLVATAAPDDAKATLVTGSQVPGVGRQLATAEATVNEGSGGTITVASGAALQVTASGGGSVVLANDANRFDGALSVLSGPAYNTAWQANLRGNVGVQSLVQVAGSNVVVGGAGIEADMIRIRADQLATSGTSTLAARMPFDQFLLGTALSAPGLTLELAPAAFGQADSFGRGGNEIHVAVGSQSIGGRTSGLNAGYLVVLPKNGAHGATAVFLTGPTISAQSGGYRFFNDGAGKQGSIPVFYNGLLPMTPQISGALSSIDGDAESARLARFQEAVRTENVTVRLRSGVIAEVGPGRPATQGNEGARPPENCTPAGGASLTCAAL